MPSSRSNEGPSETKLLREIGRRHARAQRALIGAHEIPATYCTVLTELGRHQSLPVSELARNLRIDKGWVSRVTQDMLADGLLKRASAVSDRRVVSLQVSSKGKALHRKTERLLDEQMRRVLKAAGSQGAASPREFLARLADAYEAEVDRWRDSTGGD
jgi:DNA-binding MarR family transcriptional regulator